MKAFILLLLLTTSACCSDELCRLSNELESMPEAQANANFVRLAPEKQVDLYMWQLMHSRPPASPYGALLIAQGKTVAPVLLKKALAADDFDTITELLVALSYLTPSDRQDLRETDISRAISKCRAAANDSFISWCTDLERDLAPNNSFKPKPLRGSA